MSGAVSIRSQLAVSQVTTRPWSFAEDIHAARQAGLSAIGVWRWKLHDFGPERATELLKESGLSVSSLSSAGGFTGSDGYSYRDSVLEGRKAVREAVALRANSLIVVSGARARHTWNHARRLVVDALRALGDAAGEWGLTLAVQPLRNPDGRKVTFLNTLDAALDVLHQTDRPNVGLVFDSFQLAEEVELAARIPEIAPLVKLVQFSDRILTPEGPVRCLPGEGSLPLDTWSRLLEAAGYRAGYEIHAPTSDIWERPMDEVFRDCAAALRRLTLSSVSAASTTP